MLMRVATAATLLFSLITSANAQTYGRTPGTFQVSNNGSGQYTIPLSTPPGPNGLQPNLSLFYDSQAGFGPLGSGWAIGGLGSITRCNKTVAQDSVASPVKLVQTDAYCINGNRLRQTDTSTYGSGGSIYQTEIADFSQITAYGSTMTSGAATGPQYFIVQARNGWTYKYGYVDGNGNGANSAALATGTNTVLTWFLSQVIDRSGNSMVINYVAPSTTGSVSLQGTTVPSTILWTPVSAGSSSYTYEALFLYNYGTDSASGGGNAPQSTPTGYVAGTLVKNNELLTSIQVLTSGVVSKDYFLTYQPSPLSGREQLTSIQECADAQKSACFGATSVGYQGGNPGVATSPTSVLSTGGAGLTAKYDLNGDGIPDLVYTNSSGTTSVAFGSATGYSSPVSTSIGSIRLLGNLTGGTEDGILAVLNGIWYYYTWNGVSFLSTNTTISYDTSSSGYQLADIDGDGLPDLVDLDVTSAGLTLYTRLNTSSGGVASFNTNAAVAAYTQPNVVQAFLQTPDSQYGKLRRYDFNGDGLDDLILSVVTGVARGYTVSTYEMTATAGSSSFSAGSPIAASTFRSFAPVFITNWNDDKCTDFATAVYNPAQSTYAYTLYVSACNGSPAASYPITGNVVAAIDWDNDGRTDLVVSNGAYLGVYLSTATSTLSLTPTNVPYDSTCQYVTMDVFGGGVDDLGCWSTSSSKSVSYYLHNGTTDYAASFVDGYGVSYNPTYVSLANSGGVYTKGNSAVLPYEDYSGPLYVVSTYNASDGIGAFYKINKVYSKAITNLTGYGFQGFNQIRTVDSRLGLVEYQYFSQSFPTTGMITIDNLTKGNQIQDISNHLPTMSSMQLTSAGTPARWFPYFDKTTVTDYEVEVGGPRDGTLSKTTITSYGSYDSYGNFPTITTSVADNDAYGPYASQTGTPTWTTTVNTTYVSNSAYWCNSLPSQVKITKSDNVSSGSAITRTVNYTADTDASKCRQGHQIIEPSTSYTLDTQYSYDSFGNVSTTLATGVASSVSGNNTPMARQSSIDWGATGQFPYKITDVTGQISYQTYDARFGTMKTSKDPNGITTSWMYDAFGRKMSELRPDGTSTTWSYNACTTAGCVNGNNTMTVVAQRIGKDGSTVIRTDNTYLDAFDRVLVTSGQMLNGAYDKTEMQYDQLGRLHKKSMPCAFSSCSSPYWTTYTYDSLNRVTVIQRPTSQSNSAALTAKNDYRAREIISTDFNGNSTTNTYLVTGSLQSTTDMNGYSIIYVRNAWDQPLKVQDNQSPSVGWSSASWQYGVAPFMTVSYDSDLGARNYTLDSFGDVLQYTDTKKNSFTFQYDAMSRVTSRTEPDMTTNWTWGNSAAAFNIGYLDHVTSVAGSNTYSDFYTYNGKAQLTNRTMTLPIDGAHAFDLAYDSNSGLLSTLTYPVSTNPANFRLTASYGYANGLLQSISDGSAPSTSAVWWKANTTNPRGQITNETTSSSTAALAQIVAVHTYDAVTGWLSANTAGANGGGAGLQNESYGYDAVGNVIQRQKAASGSNPALTENFFYDNLNRLYCSTLQAPAGTTNCPQAYTNLQMCYDTDSGCAENVPGPGNITSRSDVAGGALWTYDSSHPHRVLNAGNSSNVYQYDFNGNIQSRNGSNIGFTSYNYPSYVQTSTEYASFDYGPDRQRWRMVYQNASVNETTYYATPLYEKVASSAGTDYRHYIYVGNRPVMVISRTAAAVVARSLLTDHQGSISTIVNDSGGSSYQQESFTPYGVRRLASSWSGAPLTADRTAMDGVTREGYTFQTVLGGMGLNHMNGRVEDAITGVFLSADPNTVDPENTLSYNRYSYVNNNPVSLVDPSGFCGIRMTFNPGSSFSAVDNDDGTFGDGDPVTPGSYSLQFDLSDCFTSPYYHGGAGTPKPPPPIVTPSPTLIKDFICHEPLESELKSVLDDAANAGSGVDSSKSVIAVGSTAAAIAKSGYPQGTAILGTQVFQGLSVLGKGGGYAAKLGIGMDILNGDLQSVIYDGLDYGAYNVLADLGAASAAETLGGSVATTGMVAFTFYTAGGSRGVIQRAICPPP